MGVMQPGLPCTQAQAVGTSEGFSSWLPIVAFASLLCPKDTVNQ